MQLEFRTTADDYLAFFKYYFLQRKLAVRVIVLGIFCLVMGSVFMQEGALLSWTYVLIVLGMAMAIATFLFILPYRRAVRGFWGVFEAGKSDQPRKIVLAADGFALQTMGEGTEDKPVDYWRWERIKAVETNANLVMILPFHGPGIVIPMRDFPSDNEAGNFVGIIANGILRVRGSRQLPDAEKAKRIAYWGFLGLIPNVGVIAGLVLIVLGIVRYKSRLLIIIGAADILFSIGFWIVVTSFVFNSAGVKNAFKQFSKGELNTVFKSVEFYKLEHGHYPDSLKEVEDFHGIVWITDPLPHKGLRAGGIFYYQKTGDKYWLFSVGEDGEPFTADDIFPVMNPADSTKFGLRLR